MAKERPPSYKFFQNKKCEFFPCHKIAKQEDFNCLFCYCPLYSMGRKCGGDFKYLDDNTKDCSDCSWPHEYPNYDLVMDRVSVMVDQVKINDPNYKIKTVVIATSNQDKINEIKDLLAKLNRNNVEFKSLNDYPNNITPPPEIGASYYDNA